MVGEAGGGGEGELDHYIIGVADGGIREDKVRGYRDEDTWEKEEGLGDHYMPSVGLVDAHPPVVGSEALKLVLSAREVTCVRPPARQQRLEIAGGGQPMHLGAPHLAIKLHYPA
ncbi:hypothetical protein B296_00028803 [Ensete ventricosum]|uniref:Uncharacterized protein n=1 Tax=Ensete ventricosum TaxID=4639 RepID=A0A426XBY8_ENSVE|nr:hypothetical protein B296_00028803 [Ensete ventricosum]